MRDPKRIDDFCRRLASAWKTSPDLRFGQLITSVTTKDNLGLDPFYIEDGLMIQKIEEFLYRNTYISQGNKGMRMWDISKVYSRE